MQISAFNLIKKDTSAQVFSSEFCKIFRNTFFTEHLRATVSTAYQSFSSSVI